MHISHITLVNDFGPDKASGTPYWISKALQQANIDLQNIHITRPQTLLPPFTEFSFQCKKLWYRFLHRCYLSPELYYERALHIANILNPSLSQLKTDVILTSIAPTITAFLESKYPIVYWTDAVFAALANFYPYLRNLHPDTQWDGHFITEAALANARLLLVSSHWAARTAVEYYGINRSKIKIVPFGANLDIAHNVNDVKIMITNRSKKCIKLLFVGKQWYRKGGDIVLAVAKALDAAGHSVQLTIVGCIIDEKPLPAFVKCEGLISKNSTSGLKKLYQLYQEAHFLFMPSRAETYGIVFCEANAFGVPCIASYVGGIETIIKNNINGMTFSLETKIQAYCDFIVDTINDEKRYEALALSTFNEYQSRLNWRTAANQVKSLISEIL